MALRRAMILGLSLLACADPVGDHEDFLARAGARSPDAGVLLESDYADISGRWLLHAILAGGIRLGLRLQVSPKPGEDPLGPPTTFQVSIWLHDAPEEADPLITTTARVDERGLFELRANPLELGTEVIRSDTPVIADVLLHVRVLGADDWCGTAEGEVKSPLRFDLVGSTFAARRVETGQAPPALASLAYECAPPEIEGDAGPDLGAAAIDAGAGDGGRPAPPDLSEVAAAGADISGHWLMRARLAGAIPLELWASLSYSEGSEGASLDGALRHIAVRPGTEALTTFTTTVSDGRFEIWLPNFVLATPALEVEADILLVGAILDADTWCGALAGQVRRPLPIDLEGSTFGAQRWTPGTDVPADTPTACP